MKKAIFIVVFLIVIVGIGLYLTQMTPTGGNLAKMTASPSVSEIVEVSQPWIEVLSAGVYISGAETGESPAKTELKTGDEVIAGSVIETDKTGLAEIHFPDGSVARVDSDTKLTIKNASYDKNTETLVVKIGLALGRVWSKVIGLATPESSWEVETSNAVATVRGTAFGMEIVGDETTVVGSENEVEVQAIGPKSGKPIEKPTKVIKGMFLTFKNQDIIDVAYGRKAFAAKRITAALAQKEWITRFQKADTSFDERINSVKSNITDNDPIKIRNEIRMDMAKRLIELRKEILQNTASPSASPSPVSGNENLKLGNLSNAISSGLGQELSVTVAKPVSLEIASAQPLEKITEGSAVIFKSILTLSDGSKKAVTDLSEWKVSGSIGSITSPGTLAAKIGTLELRAQTAYGYVTASWKDPKTGAIFTGKSVVFNVYPKTATPTPTPSLLKSLIPPLLIKPTPTPTQGR
ncbi:MAG: periplasmic protein [Parcubacteria group bacterium Licking1014_17]|nr:MAG: periplasmic protein [Parcubacteria group bacterium Licking1014_17]